MQTRRGDIWTIGDHRLMCGDATDCSDVAKLMQGTVASLCFTSPPYAQQRDYKGSTVAWDDLMQGVFACLPVAIDAQVLVNLGIVHRECEWQPYWSAWVAWMRSIGWRRFGWYVWDKGFGLPGDWHGRLAPSFEFIFHFNRVARHPNKTKAKLPKNITDKASRPLRKRDGKTKPTGSPEKSLQTHKIPDSVIRANRHCARGIECEHPAVFPVGLCTEIITAYSNAGDTIYEPFCGSGSQIVAAERAGRRCYAMEIEPDYVDISVRRIQHDTGMSAIRQDGVAFGQVDDRLAAD